MKRILYFILAVVTAFSLCSCNKGTVNLNGRLTKEINLYFSNADYNDIQPEKRTVAYEDDSQLIGTVIDELLKGPSGTGLRAVIPKGTELNNYAIDGLTLLVDFSGEFYDYNGENSKSAELIARYSIVKTLCSLSNVDRVLISVDGRELLNASGNPVGPIGENDIIINKEKPENAAEKYVTLYFADEMGEKLFARRRRVQIVDNSVEKTIVAELVSGPSDKDDVYSTIPAGTKVLSVETKEGICFVNLSGDFITKFSGGSGAATMAIYSMVNSLTELAEVDKVQFLIDSVKTDTFGDYLFSEPFERDSSLID